MKHRAGTVRCLAAVMAAVMVFLCAPASWAAQYHYAYPSANTKKGLYVAPGMEEDALELGIQHATINLSVGEFMPDAVYRNKRHCVPYQYDGKTFWFSKDALERYDTELGRLAKETNEKNRVVTYTYNKHGDVETVTTDPNGNKYYNNGKVSTSRYKYKYDSHGNWTEKYSGRTLLVVRKITYYD